MTAQINQPMTADEQKKKMDIWDQEQLVKVQKFCFSKGVQLKAVKKERSLSLPPIIGIWYIQSTTKGEDYWVISGDLPTDIAPVKTAKNAREVTRYFSMSWQLKAARIEEAIAEGKQLGDKQIQEKMVIDLITKAEALSTMSTDDKLWEGSGLTLS